MLRSADAREAIDGVVSSIARRASHADLMLCLQALLSGI